MTHTIALGGVTRGMQQLHNAFEFGRGERPGVTDAAHAATWHMAGMIEHLRSGREEFLKRFRRGELDSAPVRPAGSEETSG